MKAYTTKHKLGKQKIKARGYVINSASNTPKKVILIPKIKNAMIKNKKIIHFYVPFIFLIYIH